MPRDTNNVWPLQKEILLYNNDQIAYTIGKKEDVYNIITFAYLNVEDNSMKYRSEVKKNWMKNNSPVLFTGTYKECYDFIVKAVEEQLKEEFEMGN